MKKTVLALAIVYVLPFYFAFMNWQNYAWFIGGFCIGLGLMLLDELVFYKQYAGATPKALELISRSPLFLVAFPILAFFAITSSTSALGVGLVLGIGLTMVAEAIALRRNQGQLRQRFAQHLSASLDDQEIRRWLWVGIIIFSVLSGLVFL